jgi:hypothetical protein
MKLTISLFIFTLLTAHSIQSMVTSKYINIKLLSNDENCIIKYSANKKDNPREIIYVSRWTFPPAENKSDFAYLFYTQQNGKIFVGNSNEEDEKKIFETIEDEYKRVCSECTDTDTSENCEDDY